MSVVQPRSDTWNQRDTVRLMRLLRGHRRYGVVQIVLSILEGFFEAAILTLFARLALGTVGSETEEVYVPLLGDQAKSEAFAILICLVIARFGAALLATWCANRLQFRLTRQLRKAAISSYVSASWSGQSDLDEGALQQLVLTLPNGVSGQLASLLIHLGHLSVMFSMLLYALFTDWSLTLVLVSVIGLATFAFKPLRRWIKNRSRRALTEQQSLSHSASELSSLKFEIQAFGVGSKIVTPLHAVVDRESNFQESASRVRGSIPHAFTVVLYLAVTLSLGILSRSEPDDFDKTGPILLVVLRSLSYGVAVQQFASGIASITPSLNLYERIMRQLRLSEIRWGHVDVNNFESVEFTDVSFQYPGADDVALRNLSVSLHIGGKIGLVGPSGGGKSTFVRLLLGVLEPTSGQILLNGVPLHEHHRPSFVSRVGVVPQSTKLVRGSVADNISFHRDHLSEDEMWAALHVANLDQLVESFPEGIKTLLGPGERQLSGGQEQRLGIARALVGNPQLVVMDEPTSSVDVSSESAISSALANLPADMTILIVSHRMKILEGCDQIIVIEDGKITFAGAPNEVPGASEYTHDFDVR